MVKFLTIELNEVIGRSGTDEGSITEIMISRSNQEMIEMTSFYNICNYYFISLTTLTIGYAHKYAV